MVDPVGPQGCLTRVGDPVAGLNHTVEAHHHGHGHVEAFRQASQKYTGPNGIITRAGEFVPGLNHTIQAFHRERGEEAALERARRHDPLGADGLLTRLGERIPILNDGIMALHLRAGQVDQAERVRARTVQGLLSKDGAVTKLAEAVPGLNLVAAALHDLRGHDAEAQRALHLLDNIRDLDDRDGALARLAELIPGVDVLAFSGHCTKGSYAHAIRAIVKMPWMELNVRNTWVQVQTRTVEDFIHCAIHSLGMEGVSITPKMASMVGGLLDLALHALGVSRFRAQKGLRDPVEDTVKHAVNALLLEQLQHQLRNLDGLARYGIHMANGALHMLRSQLSEPAWWDVKSRLLRGVLGALPGVIPQLLPQHCEAVREVIRNVAIAHSRIPSPEPVGPRSEDRRIPERAGAASCLSFLGCLGLHSSWLGCLGCFAGLTAVGAQAGRMLGRRGLSFLGDSNHTARKRVSGPGPPLLQPYQAGPGIVVEVDQEHATMLSAVVCSYLNQQLLRESPWCRRLISRVCNCVDWLVSSHRAEGQGPFLPLAIDIVVPQERVCSRRAGAPLDLTLPELHLFLLLDLGFDRNGPAVCRARVAIKDELVDALLASMSKQLMEQDLRTLHPSLSGFSEPFNLSFKACIQWPNTSWPRVEIRDLYVKMFLPE